MVKTLTAGKVTRKAENGKVRGFARLSWAAGEDLLLRHDRVLKKHLRWR